MYNRNNRQPQGYPPANGQWNQMQQGVRPSGFSGGGGYPPRKQKKKRGFGWQLFKFLLVLILVAAIGGGIYVGKAHLDVAPYTSVFLDGVSVDGINLGGMTWEEGNAAVRSQIIEELGSWYVRLKNEYGVLAVITAETLNITRDPAEALESAWAVGHDTSAVNRKTVFELQQEIQEAKANTYSFSSVEYDADMSEIDTGLANLARGAYIQPQNAEFVKFDPENILQPFTFKEEVIGRKLDTVKIMEQIMEMVNNFESGEIMMEAETLYPDITVADLQKLYTLRSRAITPIDSSSSDPRNENIRVAFSKINGMNLSDGARFSFNGVVGRRTQENGFYRALEYNYGYLVMGIGGGVCQASTTVYLAAMKAGMDLIDHTPHAMKVSYTELGLDATVSDTRGAEKDMSFRNNSGGQIYIAAHVLQDPGNKKRYICEVRIYGIDLGDVSYELETETVKEITPSSTIKYVEDEDGEYVTYDSETKLKRKASTGYVIDTYRRTYINGEKKERELLTQSTYPAYSEEHWIGVTPFNGF